MPITSPVQLQNNWLRHMPQSAQPVHHPTPLRCAGDAHRWRGRGRRWSATPLARWRYDDRENALQGGWFWTSHRGRSVHDRSWEPTGQWPDGVAHNTWGSSVRRTCVRVGQAQRNCLDASTVCSWRRDVGSYPLYARYCKHGSAWTPTMVGRPPAQVLRRARCDWVASESFAVCEVRRAVERNRDSLHWCLGRRVGVAHGLTTRWSWRGTVGGGARHTDSSRSPWKVAPPRSISRVLAEKLTCLVS